MRTHAQMLGEPPSDEAEPRDELREELRARELLEHSAAAWPSEWERPRLPFQWHGEDSDEWAGPLRGGEPWSDYVEWVLNKTHLRRLSLEDLRAMRAWDKKRFYTGMENDECHELEAHGFALDDGDPTFWPRLRKLGATPEMLTQANAILFPSPIEVAEAEAVAEREAEAECVRNEVVDAALEGRVELGRMAALPSVEDMADALRQPEPERELADARWHREWLERRLAACKEKEGSQQVEHRWVNGRWQRRQTPAEFAASRLPAARRRERRAAVAVAARRRSTCTEGPTRARARARGAGRPGPRRVARAHAPPGGEASEGEPARGRRSNDEAAVRA